MVKLYYKVCACRNGTCIRLHVSYKLCDVTDKLIRGDVPNMRYVSNLYLQLKLKIIQ